MYGSQTSFNRNIHPLMLQVLSQSGLLVVTDSHQNCVKFQEWFCGVTLVYSEKFYKVCGACMRCESDVFFHRAWGSGFLTLTFLNLH